MRFGYKKGPIKVFKLKSTINMDKLLPMHKFEFSRKTSRQGKTHIDQIRCKIRGLRQKTTLNNVQKRAPILDDGTRLLKIDGYKYRVPESSLVE